MSQPDFDAAVDAYRQALNALLAGRPTTSHSSTSLGRDDVTLANPLGPPRLGRADVEKAVEAAAANFAGRLGPFRGRCRDTPRLILATSCISNRPRCSWQAATRWSLRPCGLR